MVIKINISKNQPSRKYTSIVRKANLYDLFFMKNKAIKTLVSGLNYSLTDTEKSSAYIYIGLLYSDLKKYNKASEYFHKGLKILENEEFYYSPNFNKIIKAFVKNSDFEKATFWLENFNGRISYDKKFSKLGNLNSYINKD